MGPTGVWALVGAVLGCVLGALAHRWLARGSYRRADEADLPARHTRWLVPVSAAVLASLGAAQSSQPADLVLLLLVLAAGLVALAAIDIDVLRLPDRWTGPLALMSIGGLTVSALTRGQGDAALRVVLAAVALGVAYLLLALLSRGDFGLGDVKLAPTLGAMLGTFGWTHVLVGTFAAFLSAAIWGIIRKLARRDRHFPFGPHMVLGAVLVLVAPLLAR